MYVARSYVFFHTKVTIPLTQFSSVVASHTPPSHKLLLLLQSTPAGQYDSSGQSSP